MLAASGLFGWAGAVTGGGRRLQRKFNTREPSDVEREAAVSSTAQQRRSPPGKSDARWRTVATQSLTWGRLAVVWLLTVILARQPQCVARPSDHRRGSSQTTAARHA